MKWSILFFLLVIAGSAFGFEYTYVKTVPMAPNDTMLDLASECGVVPDLVIPVSDSAFRFFPCQTRMYTLIGDSMIVITDPLSAALQDSFFDLAHPISAEGEVFYGKFYWLFSPSRSDTIWNRCYKFSR